VPVRDPSSPWFPEAMSISPNSATSSFPNLERHAGGNAAA
jgi:hypothetical protein